MTILTKPDAAPLIEWSAAGSVALMFPKTRSAAYDAALAAARNAQMYTEQAIGKSLFHLAGFGRTREQASMALLVVRHMRSIKGFQAFGRGAELIDRFMVERVLACYVQACGCADPRAHCLVLKPAVTPTPRYGDRWAAIFPQLAQPEYLPALAGSGTFPCRYLWGRGFRPEPGHPSSEADQIQAGAVRHGCDWCPNFPGRT